MPKFEVRSESAPNAPAGLYRDGALVATAVQMQHAGFYLDDLVLADNDVLANVSQALSRRQAPLAQKAIIYEADGDVLWA